MDVRKGLYYLQQPQGSKDKKSKKVHISRVMQEQRFTERLLADNDIGDQERQEEILGGAQAVLGTSVDAVDYP